MFPCLHLPPPYLTPPLWLLSRYCLWYSAAWIWHLYICWHLSCWIFSELPNSGAVVWCHQFWKILGHYYFKYFFCSVFSSPLVFQFRVCYTFKSCSSVLGYSVPSFSFSPLMLFSLRSSFEYCQAHWFSPWLCPVYWWPHQRHSLFLLVFWFVAFFLKFVFRVSNFLIIIFLFLHVVYFYHKSP